MGIITKNTDLVKFRPNNIKTLLILKDILNIDFKTLSIYQNWTKLNNDWYYYKEFNFYEILGEYLAKSINLKTVHNIIGINKNQIEIIKTYYTLTKNFRKKSNKYFLTKDLFDKKNECKIENLEQFTKDKKNYLKLKNDILLLISLDIYMRQLDRENQNNLIFEIDSFNNLNICPIFDYSNCFKAKDGYENPLINIYFTKKDLYEKFYKYPELYDMMNYWLNFDINTALKEIQKDYNFKFNKLFIHNIEKEDQKSKQIIKKLL